MPRRLGNASVSTNPRRRLACRVSVLGTLTVLLMTQAATAQPPAGTVRVSGSVLDEDGVPLPGASVLIQEQSGKLPQQKLTTNASGAFLLPSLGRGKFSICVTVANGRYLNPCLWAPFRDSLDTHQSAGNDVRTIRIAKGALMRVLVTDATNAALAGPGQRGLQIGVWNESGLFYPLAWQSESARGAVYELVVQYEHDLRLGFWGRPLTVKLDQVLLDTRNWAPAKVRIPRGGTGVKEFALDVTGVAK